MVAKVTKELVFHRQAGVCFYCGSRTWRPPYQAGYPARKNASMDHIHLKMDGGTVDPNNVVLSCEDCNNERDNRDAAEYFMWKTRDQDPAEVYHRILFLRVAMTDIERMLNKHVRPGRWGNPKVWLKIRKEFISKGGTEDWLMRMTEEAA